jgi:L-cysteine/cystine lyase
MVAWGLDWIPGDVIVLTKHEHPANILPWYSLAKRFGCKVIFLDALQDDQEMIRQLKSLFSANTCKVMAISHVSRNTGYRLPVEQMCQVAREHNVFSLIDGAQSVGNIAVDFNAIGCDAYTFCGHKWLFGPQGTGALFIAKKSMEKIYPIWVGSKSQISYDFYGNVDWKPTMERYEFGTLATSLESGWLEALVMLSEIGYEQIFETIALVTKRLKHTIIQQGLVDVITPMDTALSSGIFVIDLRGEDEVEFSRYAWSNAKVQVSSLPCKSRIRICNHIVNSASDHEKLLQVVESFMTSKKRKSI